MSDLDQLPEELRERYFSTVDSIGFQVRPALRDVVSFATQDVCSDPPFPKLHLISCRNLLIYFRPEVQDRVVRMFHFSLRPNGALVLGPSESQSLGSEWFQPVSKKWRIFRRLDGHARGPEGATRDPHSRLVSQSRSSASEGTRDHGGRPGPRGDDRAMGAPHRDRQR